MLWPMDDCARMEQVQAGTFCTHGGYFPVLIRHGADLLVFYRAGAGHYGRQGRVDVRASRDGLAWSAPAAAAAGGTDLRNPCAGALPGRGLLLCVISYDFYHGENHTATPGHGETRVKYFRSADGRAWRPDATLDADLPAGSPFGRFLEYQGRLVMPYYSIADEHPEALCLMSGSGGRAWEQRNVIASGFVEPAIADAGGVLVAALRGWPRSVGDAETYIARSADGRAWSEPVRVTRGTGHPADLLLLSNGLLLLTWAERAVRRQRILARLSPDRGLTWSEPAQVSDTFAHCDFGYPSTAEPAPGVLVTAYYRQPDLDPSFTLADPERYSPAGTLGCTLVWRLDELMAKSGL